MPVKVWIQAARLRTLPLAIAGTVAGNLLSYAETEDYNPLVFALSVLTAILLQVLSNYANDYGDFRNGADTSERTDRVMASGLITEKKMRTAIGILISLSLVSGITLLLIAVQSFNSSFWVLLGTGIAGILAAYYYTAGKHPYGYSGFGDLSVYIFFGLLSVAGTYFLQAQTLESPIWWVASAIGLMSVGVLNINNIRDIANDQSKNKMTIPVRIGYKFALIYQSILLLASAICLAMYSGRTGNELTWLNMLICAAFFILHLSKLKKARERKDFNGQLKFLSLLTFGLSVFYCWTEIFSRHFPN